MQVVMVHGILGTPQVFWRMRRYLEARGVACLAPRLRPCDGSAALEDLAVALAEVIDRELGRDTEINLIGFSMGGLIARYYLQALGGRARTRCFLAISSPFRGTLWARMALGRRGPGVAQMAPGSTFLADLERGAQEGLNGVAVHAYWTPLDLVILPPSSSAWPPGRHRRVLVPCHPCMPMSRAVIEDVYLKLTAEG